MEEPREVVSGIRHNRPRPPPGSARGASSGRPDWPGPPAAREARAPRRPRRDRSVRSVPARPGPRRAGMTSPRRKPATPSRSRPGSFLGPRTPPMPGGPRSLPACAPSPSTPAPIGDIRNLDRREGPARSAHPSSSRPIRSRARVGSQIPGERAGKRPSGSQRQASEARMVRSHRDAGGFAARPRACRRSPPGNRLPSPPRPARNRRTRATPRPLATKDRGSERATFARRSCGPHRVRLGPRPGSRRPSRGPRAGCRRPPARTLDRIRPRARIRRRLSLRPAPSTLRAPSRGAFTSQMAVAST